MAEDDDEGLKSVFKTYDKDNSGHIDAKELREMLTDLEFEIPSEDYFTRLVQKLDESGDGQIEFPELQHWWTKTEEVMDALEEATDSKDPKQLAAAYKSGCLMVPPLTSDLQEAKDILKELGIALPPVPSLELMNLLQDHSSEQHAEALLAEGVVDPSGINQEAMQAAGFTDKQMREVLKTMRAEMSSEMDQLRTESETRIERCELEIDRLQNQNRKLEKSLEEESINLLCF